MRDRCEKKPGTYACGHSEGPYQRLVDDGGIWGRTGGDKDLLLFVSVVRWGHGEMQLPRLLKNSKIYKAFMK